MPTAEGTQFRAPSMQDGMVLFSLSPGVGNSQAISHGRIPAKNGKTPPLEITVVRISDVRRFAQISRTYPATDCGFRSFFKIKLPERTR